MVGSYLILCGFHGWPVLREDHGQGEEKHEQSVTHVTKHHSEEKGESDDGVGSCRQTGYSQAGSQGGPPGPGKSMFMRQGSQCQQNYYELMVNLQYSVRPCVVARAFN